MRIVIVDDEQIVLRGLQTIIERSGQDWTVVAQCTSAESALPVIDELLPDIVISDIRMYELSGIGLAAKIKEKHEDILVILLTGYAEFDYAHQAIKLTVFEYLLKPTRYNDIVECLSRAERKIKLRQGTQKNLALQMAESRFLMREKFLNDLMKGFLPVSTDIVEKSKEYGLQFSRYTVFCFSYPENGHSFGPEGKDRFLLDYGIKNVVVELLTLLEHPILMSEKLGSFTVLGSLAESTQGKNALEEMLRAAVRAVDSVFQLPLSIGVSPESNDAETLFDSYSRAGYACVQAEQTGKQIVCFEDLEYTPPYEAYPESVCRAIEFIDAQYHTSITLQQTAEVVYLNAWYLSDLFKREVGMSFSEYVQNKRIEKAKQLLRETQMKLYEIAYAVGIKEQAYLSNLFKKATGMTPKKYREHHAR